MKSRNRLRPAFAGLSVLAAGVAGSAMLPGAPVRAQANAVQAISASDKKQGAEAHPQLL